jgi:hypothetical protein
MARLPARLNQREEAPELRSIGQSAGAGDAARRQLITFFLVAMGAFLSVGYHLAFLQNNYLRSHYFCGMPYLLARLLPTFIAVTTKVFARYFGCYPVNG